MSDELNFTQETVLVTGGSGLVGRCLEDELSANNGVTEFTRARFIFLSSRDADLTQIAEARAVFEKYKPNYVIHLAAKVGGLYANLADDKGAFYKINNRLNENVLALSFEFNVKRCISCLSTCIFPDAIELPLDESKVHLGPPHSSNESYALAKRRVDRLNEHYNAIRRRRRRRHDSATNEPCGFYSIIPTNIYGPHDQFDLQQAHVIPGLIHRAFIACEEAQARGLRLATLNVHGSGTPMRQFIYARDLAKLILWSLDGFDDVSQPRLIMCPDLEAEASISQVADIICRIYSDKFKLQVETSYDANKSDGQSRKTASNDKLRRLKPDFEFTSLAAGLRETIDWFCGAYPRVRGSLGDSRERRD